MILQKSGSKYVLVLVLILQMVDLYLRFQKQGREGLGPFKGHYLLNLSRDRDKEWAEGTWENSVHLDEGSLICTEGNDFLFTPRWQKFTKNLSGDQTCGL